MGKRLLRLSNIVSVAFVTLVGCSSLVVADDTLGGQRMPAAIQSVLQQRCGDCHGADVAEGNVRLDDLTERTLDERLELWNQVQEQIFFGQMPPDDDDKLDKEAQRIVL